MSETLTCKTCGSSFKAGAFGGKCPRCMMGVASVGSRLGSFEVLPAEELDDALPEFEVQELVGRGGMGAVYRARQLDLDREVAIKLLAPDAGADPEFAERFSREAQVTAKLDHPGIVPVYGVGYDDLGRCYYTMRMVRGRELGEIFRTWSLARSVAVIVRVCQAMAFAHGKGVVHRDLKPSNIMVGELGEVYIMDWGLAKTAGVAGSRDIRLLRDFGGDSPLMTMDGAVVGTPAYMPPEQALSRIDEVDHLSDIYSLGAILYELLAGHPPYSPTGSKSTPAQVLQTLTVQPPERLRGKNAKAPAELVAVCEKAMSRQRVTRYQNAIALANDLQAWLDGRVVAAHGTGALITARKWVGRNRSVAALTVLALFTVIVVQFIANRGVSSALGKEQIAKTAALATLAESQVSAGLQAGTPAQAALFFDRAAAIAPDAEAQLNNRVRTAEWSRSATRIVRAFMADGVPDSIELHPTGRFMRVAVGGQPRLYDVAAERLIELVPGAKLWSAGWSPVSPVLAAVTDAEAALVLYDLPTLAVRTKLPAPGGSGGEVVFSADGSLVAAGLDECRVWRVDDGRLLCYAKAPSGKWCVPVCISPDGTRLVVRTDKDRLCLFPIQRDGGSVEPLVPPFAFTAEAGNGARHASPEFIPRTPHFLHTRKSDKPGGTTELVWRDSTSGKEFKTLPDFEFFGGLSPDGETFAGRMPPLTGTFDVTTAAPRTIVDFPSAIHHSCNSPDGSQLLFTCSDLTAAPAFDALGGERMTEFKMPGDGPQLATYSANGLFVATAQRSGLIQVHSLAPPAPTAARSLSLAVTDQAAAGQTALPVIHPGGKLVALGGCALIQTAEKNRRSRVLDIATGAPVGPVLDPGGYILSAEFTPDGDILALLSTAGHVDRSTTQFLPGGLAGNLQLWNWRNGTRHGDPIPMPSEPRCIIFRSGMAHVWCGGGQVVEVDLATRAVATLFQTAKWQPFHVTNYGRIAHSPDGNSLFAWQQGDLVTAWDLAGDRPLFPPVKTGASCADLAFLPGSGTTPGVFATVASYPDNAHIRFFDRFTGQPAGAPIPVGSHASRCQFSPDGRRILVTTTQAKAARIYDWRTGTMGFPEVKHRAVVHSAVFIPGTPWCISGDAEGVVQLWDGETGKLIIPPLGSPGIHGIHDIKVTPDGRHVLYSPHASGELRILDIGSLRSDFPLSPKGLQLLCELNAGATLQQGSQVFLDTREWFERWAKLRAAHPDFHILPENDAFAPLARLAIGPHARIVVTHTNDAGPGSLRAALSTAAGQSGADEIVFAAALNGQTITLASRIDLSDVDKVTIDASSLRRGITITRGSASDHGLFHIADDTDATFHSLTFKDGGGSGVLRGGAFENLGSLHFTRCTFVGNRTSGPGSTFGGAIYSEGALSLTQCTLSGNKSIDSSGAEGGGGAIHINRGMANLIYCTIAGNSATRRGGGVGIGSAGTLTLEGCIISDNTLTGGIEATNGADLDNQGNVTTAGINIVQKLASDREAPAATTGGTILGIDPQLAPLGDHGGPTHTMPPLPGSPAINPPSGANQSPFKTDQRGRGFTRRFDDIVDIGAVEHRRPFPGVPATIMTVTTEVDEDNGMETGGISLREAITAAPPGAVIDFAPGLSGKTIRLTKFSPNPGKGASSLIVANRSGGLTIDASALPGGLILTDAGAASYRLLEVENSLLTLRGLTFKDGGISSFHNASGGAINSRHSTVIIERCTFTGNISDGGGAIHNEGINGSMTIRHCTFSGNTVSANSEGPGIGGDGGAIFNANAVMILSHCTLSGNTAPNAAFTTGGIMSYLGKITISDCIIAGNTIDKGASPGDLRSHIGILILSGVNLISSYTVHGGSIVRNHGTTIAAAPLLAALADNGGPSMTMALLPGSPAIDAAVGSSRTLDQRGFRVVGTADIGAFEAGVSTAPPPEGEGIRRTPVRVGPR